MIEDIVLFYFKGSGGAVGIAARGQIYMGVPISVVAIHLQLEIATHVKVPPGATVPSPSFAPPLFKGFGKFSQYKTMYVYL